MHAVMSASSPHRMRPVTVATLEHFTSVSLVLESSEA
jgi:hypothetical protein